MFEAASRLASATHPLVVGDRLDTDIAGASAMGWDSMLVLSGTSTPPDLLRSAALPAYVARDLSAVLGHAPAARFRPATPADADALVALVRSASLSVEGIEDRLADTLVSDGQDLGGVLSITATACLQPVEGFGILRSVAVHPNLRGCGLGMLATAAACRLARDRGIAHVTLFTETAAPFFGELGFRTVDRGALPEPVATSPHAAEECASTGTAMVLEL
jgi:N-acetylglutamate synthase-like GNAT family acetyltransferase